MILEDVMLSEMSQTERQTVRQLTFMWDFVKVHFIAAEGRLVVVRDWRVGKGSMGPKL